MPDGKVAQEVLRIESEPVNQDSCPDCGQPLVAGEACEFCPDCGYSPCG